MKWIFAILILVNGVLATLTLTQQPMQVIKKSLPEEIGDLKIVSDVDLKVLADYQKRQQDQLAKLEANLKPPQAKTELMDKKSLTPAASGCFRIGRFDDPNDAEGISAGLANYRVVSSVEKETLRKNVGYWAMLPGSGVAEEGAEFIASLKEEGFLDIRQFTSGEFAGSVSLGLFSSELNAVRQVRKAEKLGHIATVTPKFEEVTGYWVVFDKPADFTVPMESIHNAFPEVAIKACEVIAR